VEAEALGAPVFFGDGAAGPRIKSPLINEADEEFILAEEDFTKGRIAQVLAACKLLKSGGEYVALEISGHITILSSLMDLSLLFKIWRRKQVVLEYLLTRLTRFILSYAEEALKAGVDIISYADPVGSYSIIGPKYAEYMVKQHTAPMLSRMTALLPDSAALHLCPKTAFMLRRFNCIKETEIKSGGGNYAALCLMAAGKKKVFGQACLKNKGLELNNGKIKAFSFI
jgi:uroporphyrinogen-III decarboxylase